MAKLNTTLITGDLTVSNKIYCNSVEIGGDLSLRNLTATGTITGEIVGNLTGNVTGNITGNIIGDIEGDVNGNVNGNAATATALNLSSSVGSATKPVYFSAEGKPLAVTYSLEQNVTSSSKLTDTLNTAGATANNNAKLYLVGATAQSANPQTYTKDALYSDIDGALYATSFKATSSKKLKENIKDSEVDALNLIKNTKIVDFNYINDSEKTPKIGFIAEDSDTLLSTPHNNVMDMTNCIGLLLKANQQLLARIEILEKQLKETR